ncbi:MAG: hypothetical protein KAS67_01225, partial [Thermoplasmata archaeon]|nr:hypothetical protein [Thermoplasmata archaeon]
VDKSAGYPLTDVVLDQSVGNPADAERITLTYTYGQTFRPSATGKLISIQLPLQGTGPGDTTNDYTFDIRSTSEGLPSGAAGTIASETVTLTLSDVAYYSIDIVFSAMPTLTAGIDYAIVATHTGIEYWWWFGDSYADGTGASSNDGGESWGSTQDFVFSTYMEVPTGGLSKFAWHSSGEYGMAVTGVDDEVWYFTRETGTWTTLGHQSGGSTFNDIVYDSFSDRFYMVGWTSTNTPVAIYHDGASFINAIAPAQAFTQFRGVEVCGGVNGYHILAVGDDGSVGYAAWYNGAAWMEIASGWDAGGEVAIAKDAAWNQRTDVASSKHYVVGIDDENTGFVYELDGPGDQTITRLYTSYTDELDSQNAISWCPRWADGAQYDYAVIVGQSYHGYGNIYKFDGTNKPVTIVSSSDIFYDVAWTTDGNTAVIVGKDASGNGKVLHHGVGTDMVADLTGHLPAGTGQLNGVAYKGYSSPSSGIIIGSSGALGAYPSATDTLTTITVNAAFPHNFDIDMWKTSDAGRTSKLNQQNNVETTYTFFCEANYTVSGLNQFYADGVDNVRVELTAWYDDGGVSPNPPAEDDEHRTRVFRALWSEGPAVGFDTTTMLYPVGSPGTDEVLLDSAGLEFGPGDHYYIYFNITIGPQTRAADSAGTWNPSSDLWTPGNPGSFNDPDSWNFQMNVYDDDFAGAYNTTYEEFGLFRFTNVTAIGNPTGNVPPGANDIFLGSSQLACAANAPYFVNVSIPRLNKTTDDSKFIPASSVAVLSTSPLANNTNTQINSTWTFGRPFLAANEPLGIWGNVTQGPAYWNVAAPQNGTTAHGPWGSDFNGYGATQIDWYISVPGGTEEGIYRASVTFEIGVYG